MCDGYPGVRGLRRSSYSSVTGAVGRGSRPRPSAATSWCLLVIYGDGPSENRDVVACPTTGRGGEERGGARWLYPRGDRIPRLVRRRS